MDSRWRMLSTGEIEWCIEINFKMCLRLGMIRGIKLVDDLVLFYLLKRMRFYLWNTVGIQKYKYDKNNKNFGFDRIDNFIKISFMSLDYKIREEGTYKHQHNNTTICTNRTCDLPEKVLVDDCICKNLAYYVSPSLFELWKNGMVNNDITMYISEIINSSEDIFPNLLDTPPDCIDIPS